MKAFLNILISFLIVATSYAQKGKFGAEYFKDVPIYTDLNEALKTPSKILHLDLSKQKLTKFPMDILKLTNLEVLILSKNKLSKLPPEIVNLKNLSVLDISRNQFEELPSYIGNLENLTYIELNKNPLLKLPDEIGNLPNLETLSIWSTEITTLPASLKNVKTLKTIDLRVITLSAFQMESIRSMFPESVKIFFSNDCKCGP
jgi:Leucine-rich repeat (LRR) protein